jgi:CBS domain containing-hemolysin-like protein
MLLLITYLLLALVVSFLCSILESVLLSVPQPYLVTKKEEGLKWAVQFLNYKDNIDKPLSAILTLNTIAHTVGAAGVGAEAVKVFGETYFGWVSAILTVLILVFTEIIPKTLGASYNKQLAHLTVTLLKAIVFITYPIVLVSSYITKLISSNSTELSTSREEIAAMASIGREEGLFSENENKIIQNLLRLKNIRVSDIMTPRVVVASANEELLLSDFMKDKDNLKFSRIPVYQGSYENINGYVFRQEVFENLAEDQHNLRVKDIKRSMLFVPDNLVLFTVWEKLVESKEHMALVVDEYGSMRGVVTMEDIIETLLGIEIIDEKDTIVDMQKYAKERWKARQKEYNIIMDLKKGEIK